MNSNETNDGNVFILNFTFNRRLRILQHAEQVIQLRKKEADVLALLCDKHPNPVSQNDFLMNVWGGGYVTSQSIAQVIRSLRLSLGDEKKSIISTIPKLGYKLAVTPVYENVVPTSFQYGEVIKVSHESEAFSYAEQQAVVNVIPSSSSISIIPCIHARKKFSSTKKIIFSSVILIFGSLACVTLSARSISVESLEQLEQITQEEPTILVERRKNIIENVNEYITHCNIANDTIISFISNKNMHDDCFSD